MGGRGGHASHGRGTGFQGPSALGGGVGGSAPGRIRRTARS
jgi:hypothetical protein